MLNKPQPLKPQMIQEGCSKENEHDYSGAIVIIIMLSVFILSGVMAVWLMLIKDW
jgi:hypothetical protein